MINKLGVRFKSFVLYGRSLVTSFATLLTDFFVCLKAIEFQIKEAWSKGESPLNKMFAFTTRVRQLNLGAEQMDIRNLP